MKTIDLDILPDDAKKELIDFYEYLVKKYKRRENVELLEIYKKYNIKLPPDYLLTINLIEKKFMKDKVFIDTNILIYFISDEEPKKADIKRDISG